MRESLLDRGYCYQFFQAVRLLELVCPERVAVGREGPPWREIVRFGARLSLAFPASEIHELMQGDGEDPQFRMTVNMMGLTGPQGALPLHYTELLLARAEQKDHALGAFLDIFNHRLTSLFYRAWEKYHYPVTYGRGQRDVLSQWLRALVGIHTAGLQDRLDVSDQALCFYSGLLNQRPHSSSAMEGILRDYFEIPVRTMQFVGKWMRLGPENHTRLGSQNSCLGVNAICGERVYDRQSKFRLQLGPLDLATFGSFLPSGSAFRALTQLTRFVAGLEHDFDILLILKKSEVPECRLQSYAQDGPRLGWSSWLKIRQFSEDAEDTILSTNN